MGVVIKLFKYKKQFVSFMKFYEKAWNEPENIWCNECKKGKNTLYFFEEKPYHYKCY